MILFLTMAWRVRSILNDDLEGLDMKCVKYTEYGDSSVLELRDTEKPIPLSDEILVENHATTVTPGDIANRKGESFLAKLFTGLNQPKNQVLGYEFSGRVAAVGQNVTRFQVGDEVFGTTGRSGGANAEYLCLSQDGLISIKPHGLSFSESAALPIGSISALYFLRKANIQQGESILVYGASGSIGSYAIQLAKYFGAKTTAVCSAKNFDLVRSLGADETIDYTVEDFTQRGQKYDYIFDVVGKTSYKSCKSALSPKGLFLSVYMPISHLFYKQVIGGIVAQDPEDVAHVGEMASKGIVRPVIDREFGLEDISKAHDYVELGHKTGNVLVRIKND